VRKDRELARHGVATHRKAWHGKREWEEVAEGGGESGKGEGATVRVEWEGVVAVGEAVGREKMLA
jgi:hypothetical protein